MKPIHVAATIVRLFAVCLALYALILLLNTWMFYVSSDTPIFSILSVSIPSAFLIISVVLWNFPISVSRKMTGLPPSLDDENLSFTSDQFLSICLFSLGVFFLYELVGNSVYWAHYLANYGGDGMRQEMSVDQRAALWSLAAQAIFTVVLLAGNQAIVNIFNRMRYGGLR